ncbi:hypothetical protein Nepgr_014586 [Nepenthes gracilis]|uniref:protein geranylgeranyltransferase type II n=1 Tax=Nepenthes gracilis TaxID=150966 RepID=A0AAD3SL45_NEPGR|nr:hypothetical protein Nepgr_014586 [Nepenthes gracilis]
MVWQKRLDYGFVGYQVPPNPQAKRSARRRGSIWKKVEDNRLCAFDLLATVAGKLLLEGEISPTARLYGKDQGVSVQDVVNQEQHDECKLSKIKPCDQGSTGLDLLGQPLGLHSHSQQCKKTSNSQYNACSGDASALTTSNFSAKISSDQQTVLNYDRREFSSLPRKIEGFSPGGRESCVPKLEDQMKEQKQNQLVNTGEVPFGPRPDMCSSEDPKVLDRKPPALVTSGSSGKMSFCNDHNQRGSLSLYMDNVTVVSRDDDENSSGCTQPSTTMKSARSRARVNDSRIRKLFASNYWRVDPKVKDGNLFNTDGELLPVYRKRKIGYKRQRSQRIYPFMKRKLLDCSSVSNPDSLTGCKSLYESPEKAANVNGSALAAKRHEDTGTSSSVAGQSASFLAREPHVKLRIKSFCVPELLIELPETATVGSLKRGVIEAVTALLGDGLHVGVLFRGKKIRDDDKTLLQCGISHDNMVDALGFTLEPIPSRAFPPVCSEVHSLLHSSDAPLLVPSGSPLATSIVHQGVSHLSANSPATNLGTSMESDHDSAPSPAEILTEKSTNDSRALVTIPEPNAHVLAVLPLDQKSKQTEIAQRRIRRPFSVSEVEALVQAVEKLGTGRWRDVKRRAFDNVKHRTYVDLKDKWKTLVHTAKIFPQQRRGEPVPQELLDRVLTAHAHWSQQQAKQQQLKQQSEVLDDIKGLILAVHKLNTIQDSRLNDLNSITNDRMAVLAVEKHVHYILSVEKKKDDFESVVMEHLRMSGAYWGLMTLDLLGKLGTVDHDEVISWVMKCQHESGGFGGNVGHDPHVLFTLSAVQVLALFDKIHILDIDKVSSYIAGLQNENGSFSGDIWGEVDTRFSYIAICALALLHRLDKIDVEKAVSYIASCKNLDGGFGCTPGGESHAGQIFCCVAALAITGSLHHVDKDLLGWWLCERQVKSGGLNGRPEKLPDVCYSWWVLSSLIMIDRVHWIDREKLVKFILDCQDLEKGGISDRPDDAVDVFHTYFGVAGLSLLEYPELKGIDPAYALPVDVVNRLFIGR